MDKEYISRYKAMEICEKQAMYCLRENDTNGQYVADEIAFDIMKVPAADVVEVRHGEWVKHDGSKDDFYHHRCSICKVDAPFHYVETEDYDEGMDGEWYPMGLRITDIVA